MHCRCRLLKGYFLWKILKTKYHINYKKLVVVLSGQNKAVDQNCIELLPLLKKRKYVDDVIIISDGGMNTESYANYEYEQVLLSSDDISKLYDYYSFHKFFDNIIFTHTSTPKDNMLQRYLDETEIDEKDAVCLALFHMRTL